MDDDMICGRVVRKEQLRVYRDCARVRLRSSDLPAYMLPNHYHRVMSGKFREISFFQTPTALDSRKHVVCAPNIEIIVHVKRITSSKRADSARGHRLGLAGVIIARVDCLGGFRLLRGPSEPEPFLFLGVAVAFWARSLALAAFSSFWASLSVCFCALAVCCFLAER